MGKGKGTQAFGRERTQCGAKKERRPVPSRRACVGGALGEAIPLTAIRCEGGLYCRYDVIFGHLCMDGEACEQKPTESAGDISR